MEQNKENRITEGLLDWTEKENRLRSVFGNDVIKGKEFLQSKREFFNVLFKSCRPDANPEEKVMLNVIRGETRKLDKLICPNAGVRLLVLLVNKVKDRFHSRLQGQGINKEMLVIKPEHTNGGYNKKQNSGSRYQRNKLREPAGKVLNAYKTKERKGNMKQSEDEGVAADENKSLSKKKVNPNNGRSIY